MASRTVDEGRVGLLAPSPAVTTAGNTQDRVGFRWEAEMTQLVASQVGRLMPPGGAHVVVGEVPAAQGIADVVAVRFDTEALQHRFDNAVGPITSPLRVRVLHMLGKNRTLRTSTLAERLGTTGAALTRSTLGPLAELGLVEMRADTVTPTGAWRPLPAHVTAVELKLSKWKDALRQADNFAMSADRAWLVLDAARSAAAVRESTFIAAFGVGLAVVDTSGELQVVARPRGRRPERWLRALMAEQVWAAAQSESTRALATTPLLDARPPTIQVVRGDSRSGDRRETLPESDRSVQAITDKPTPVCDGHGSQRGGLLGCVADLVAFGEREIIRTTHLDTLGAATRLISGFAYELLVDAPRHGAEKLWLEVRKAGLWGPGHGAGNPIDPRPRGHASAESECAPSQSEPTEPT